MKIAIIGLILCAALVGTASAGEKVVVIVNEANANAQGVTAADLKNMYNDIVIHWSNDQPIDLYDTPVSAEARKIFSEKVLGVSPNEAAREWANRKITNTAKNPPKTTKEELVPKLVARDPNAIGYVSASVAEGKQGIKVIMTLE